MRVFSRNIVGYARLLLPAAVTMAVIALVRFGLAPVFGITQGPLERILSMTTVVIVSLVVYGVLLGVGDGRAGDVTVVALGW